MIASWKYMPKNTFISQPLIAYKILDIVFSVLKKYLGFGFVMVTKIVLEKKIVFYHDKQ